MAEREAREKADIAQHQDNLILDHQRKCAELCQVAERYVLNAVSPPTYSQLRNHDSSNLLNACHD